MAAHNGQSNTLQTGVTLPGIGNSISLWNRSWFLMTNGGNSSGNITLNFNFTDYNGSSPVGGTTYALLFNSSDGTFSSGSNTLLVNSGTVSGNTVSFTTKASNLLTGYYTIMAIPTTSIAYSGSPFCSQGTTTPTITGLTGGTFTSTTGLSINSSTGQINLATSTAGTYTVTYTYNGGSSTTTTSVVINALPTATISYSGSPYCATGTATVTQSGTSGGTYSSTTGLSIAAGTGAINLAASTPGTYTVTYSFTNGTCSNTTTTTITINALPTVYSLTGGGIYCSGTSGSVICLSGSETGVTYKLVQLGLWATYYGNKNLTGSPTYTELESNVNYPNSGSGFGPYSGNGAAYSTNWSGYVIAPVSGNYTFTTISDDGIRLSIAGNQIINNWTNHAATTNNSTSVYLVAGQSYSLNLQYYQQGGNTQAQL